MKFGEVIAGFVGGVSVLAFEATAKAFTVKSNARLEKAGTFLGIYRLLYITSDSGTI
jgi:hypothetical protein